jgi:hypothetical protein
MNATLILISAVCALAAISLIVALIFNPRFRKDIIGGQGRFELTRFFSAEGAIIVVLFGICLVGMIYPMVLLGKQSDVAKEMATRVELISEIDSLENNDVQGLQDAAKGAFNAAIVATLYKDFDSNVFREIAQPTTFVDSPNTSPPGVFPNSIPVENKVLGFVKLSFENNRGYLLSVSAPLVDAYLDTRTKVNQYYRDLRHSVLTSDSSALAGIQLKSDPRIAEYTSVMRGIATLWSDNSISSTATTTMQRGGSAADIVHTRVKDFLGREVDTMGLQLFR